MPAEEAMTWTMRSSHQRSASVKVTPACSCWASQAAYFSCHAVGVGDELVVFTEREADQRDEVGQACGARCWRRTAGSRAT